MLTTSSNRVIRSVVLALVVAAPVSGATAPMQTEGDHKRFRSVTSTGLVPLCEMGEDRTYKGQDGGLYGQGQNDPPPAHAAAARGELAAIRPLDAGGRPSADGKIVLMSIGMSNTRMEFAAFRDLARTDPKKSAEVVVVNAAIGGMDVTAWAESRRTQWGTAWEGAERRLKEAEVTPEQVQVIWLKQAKIGPAGSGEFPAHARELAEGTLKILHVAKQQYPNLRIAYLSSRIYAGHASIGLNPEPYAYESAFSVRWLIRQQIRGDAELNYDPAKGAAKCPLLLWGPYLWADGVVPRKSDGLTWQRENLAADGTHPSQEDGTAKVAKMLLKFFQSDPFARTWYLSRDAQDGLSRPLLNQNRGLNPPASATFVPYFFDDFEAYDDGVSLSAGRPFDAAGRTTASSEAAHRGHRSARMAIHQGDQGGFGRWGGIIPIQPVLRRGSEIWVRLFVLWPEGFEFSAAPWMKFIRLHNRTDVPTISTADGVIDYLYLLTYWNNEQPPANHLFVDDIAIATSACPPPNSDASGNACIGDWMPQQKLGRIE